MMLTPRTTSTCRRPPWIPRRSSLPSAVLALGMLAGCAAPARSGGSEGPARPAAVQAPDSLLVEFATTRGPVQVLARRAWAPQGVDRFYAMVQGGFYDDVPFYRVVPGFVAQFGQPWPSRWREHPIPDDPVRQSNRRGTLTMARSGVNSRTTEMFFNLKDNAGLDNAEPSGVGGPVGFTPIAEVVRGMEVVDSLYAGYGDFPQFGGRAPTAEAVHTGGRGYLAGAFPRMDYIRGALVLQEWR